MEEARGSGGDWARAVRAQGLEMVLGSGGRGRKADEPAEMKTHFEFGRNWQRFLSMVDERPISEAAEWLRAAVGQDRLNGVSFLDVGSGSRLFSLVAVRLGARRVHSVDADPRSVAFGHGLRLRYAAGAKEWPIERGDPEYLGSLERFDEYVFVRIREPR